MAADNGVEEAKKALKDLYPHKYSWHDTNVVMKMINSPVSNLFFLATVHENVQYKCMQTNIIEFLNISCTIDANRVSNWSVAESFQNA